MKLKVLYGAILVIASLAAPIQALANPVTLVCVGSQEPLMGIGQFSPIQKSRGITR
jgi:hypothetical protein